MQRFDKDNLPSDPESWDSFVKRQPTRAVRIEGAFEVYMPAEDSLPAQMIRCQDGYLAMDVRGIPFPVPAEAFEKIYKRVES